MGATLAPDGKLSKPYAGRCLKRVARLLSGNCTLLSPPDKLAIVINIQATYNTLALVFGYGLRLALRQAINRHLLHSAIRVHAQHVILPRLAGHWVVAPANHFKPWLFLVSGHQVWVHLLQLFALLCEQELLRAGVRLIYGCEITDAQTDADGVRQIVVQSRLERGVIRAKS